MRREGCISVFVKFPEKGKVKSRLSKDLSEEAVLIIYKKFVIDLLNTLEKGEYAYIITFLPSDAREQIQKWLGKNRRYIPQQGANLGERMKNAFMSAFSEGFSKTILIGSDIPDLSYAHIHQAMRLQDHDAVIGPSYDGGYYLIGFRSDSFLPQIFEGIPWGTSAVFEETMEIFRRNNCKVHTLPTLRDVDTIDDLRDLVDRSRNTEFISSETMAYLSQLPVFLK